MNLPAGFLAAPVSPADAGAPLRLCAVLRETPDPVTGTLVPLGERPDASQFLGCILEVGVRVREWLEWSVQTGGAPDAEWTRRALALRDLAPERFLETGWEARRPAPAFLDPAGGEPAAEAREGFIPFNPAGDLVLAQTFMPLPLEAFSDALSGRAWAGLPQGRGNVPLGRAYEALRHIEEPEAAGTHLFTARRGRAGRLAEVFHLKLCLLGQAARATRAMVAATRAPMLDLSAESFRVTLAETGSGLPFLWTARAVLAQPGGAQAVSVPAAGEALRYFLPAAGGPTRYRPAEFGRLAGGRSTVRVRQVRGAEGEPVALEGTLIADDNLPEAISDLLRLQLRLGDGERVELFGHLETKEGLATGEARFRTVPQHLPAPAAAALRAAAGASFANTAYEIVPMLGSPCDLYALGVLAVRLLLVNDSNTLAVALDETLSLARQAGAGDGTLALETRLEALAQDDPCWTAALGPQRLLRSGAAVDTLPGGLWWEALAAILRCFPGMGPDSTCRDLGDAPTGAPEAVFDRLIRDLEALTARTQSLIVIDWAQNREIRAAIARVSGPPRAD